MTEVLKQEIAVTSHDHLCDLLMWKVLVDRQELYRWRQDLHSETQPPDVVSPASSASLSLSLSLPWPFLWLARPWRIRDPGLQWQVFYPNGRQHRAGPEINSRECPGERRDERQCIPEAAVQSQDLSSPAPAASLLPLLLLTLQGTALNTDLNTKGYN